MSFHIWAIGKTKEPYLKEGIRIYEKRVQHYAQISTEIIPHSKNAGKLTEIDLKQTEGMSILKKLRHSDYLVLLDERGKLLDSIEFASMLQMRMIQSQVRTIFLIGGAYGFSEDVRRRSNKQLSLSKMTFSHQLIRLIFWEQLYRAIAINNHLPYHND